MRKIMLIILVLAFFAVCTTGIQLVFIDEGPQTEQHPAIQGETKGVIPETGQPGHSGSGEHFIKELHVLTGFILLIAGLAHLSHNVRFMMRGKRRI